MDFRILGPLEVRDEGRTIELGGHKQRALLAILLLHPNEVVSADRLIDLLWDERPPPSALKRLHAHVSRLRRALDHDGAPSAGFSDGVLVTRGHGYVLRVAPGELDADRFRELLEQGRSSFAAVEPETAARTLRAGLSLWRGPPLSDFAYDAFAQPAFGQLEELRLEALEARIEADLALARHRELIGELTELVERHPLRERLRGQLMVALYRSGRQAEALGVYQRFRQNLSEELGLDPSSELQQLEAAILNRSESLELPVAPRPSAERTAIPSRTKPATRKRRRVGLEVGGSIAVVIAITAAVLARTSGGTGPAAVISADAVGAINPARGAITAVVPLGSSPARLTAGDGAVWASSYSAGTVSRIDETTRAVVQTIQAGSTPSGIAVGAGAVWVANNFAGTVSRIDPAINRVVQPIAVGNGPSGVAVGDGSVWVTNSSDGTLSRIDAVSGRVAKTIPLGGGATDVAAGLGAVWVSDEPNGRVLRVDPNTNHVTELINVGNGPNAITVGDRSVWVANSLDGTVSRIDPTTNRVTATISVGQGPSAIAIGAGGVWVANEFGGSVARIDPTRDLARPIRVGNRPQGIVFARGLVWVGSQAIATSHRGGTLTVLQHGPFGSSDPVTAGPASILTLHMTNDGLTAYKQVGGSDGEQLVPDLATSLPTPTDGGRTYTFTLRPGIRYSNGAPVRPEDFRRAIERNLELGPGASSTIAYPYYQSIVGSADCVARPARCDLSRGIITDDKANTVTFHLLTPDPEFPARLAVWTAAAVPERTPSHDIGTHPLPATGPYQIAQETPRQVTIVRNPYFREWSHAAQPDGYPDRIVFRVGDSTEAAVTAVEAGSAEYTLDPPPPNRLQEVQTRFASQLKVTPSDATIQLVLNTRAAPFTDVRVRRALNYALDRTTMARLLGQQSHPTCQQLPPYIAGFKRYCPYTLNPNRTGTWSAPDLAKAKALIAASGTRGTPITVWSAPGYLTDFTAAGHYLVSLLRRLGYPAKIKAFPATNDPSFFQILDSRTKAQAVFSVLAPNYPAASEFLGPQVVSCHGFMPNSTSNENLPEFCNRQHDATVRAALAAELVNSAAARELWAHADRQFTDHALAVQLATPSITDFVSHRVGNYQYNPQLGVLLDQLWVH